MGIIVFDLYGKEQEAAVHRANAVREFQNIEERENILTTDLAVLNTERGKEALIRNTFDVAKPGEEVIIVLDALPATTTEEVVERGFVFWFLSLFE